MRELHEYIHGIISVDFHADLEKYLRGEPLSDMQHGAGVTNPDVLGFIFSFVRRGVSKKLKVHPTYYLTYPKVTLPIMASEKMLSLILRDRVSPERISKALQMQATVFIVSSYFGISLDLGYIICRATTACNSIVEKRRSRMNSAKMQWLTAKKVIVVMLLLFFVVAVSVFQFAKISVPTMPRFLIRNVHHREVNLTGFNNRSFGNTQLLHKYCDDHMVSLVPPGSRNEIELSNFRKLMKTWPISVPKAAVILLIDKAETRMKMLKRLLLQYETNFAAKFTNYPIILFHDKNFPEDLKLKIRSWSKTLHIFLYLVSFEYPNCFVIRENVAKAAPCSGHTIGYRHMCRFMMLKMFHQEIIHEVEYYWRLDTDSELPSPVAYDVFKKMRDENLEYAFKSKTSERASCMLGLRESTERYVKLNHIKPTFLAQWGKVDMFYNNFEVSKISFWTSVEVQNFLRYIDVLGGVYYIRWGDAPIKSLAVAVFMDKSKVRQFNEIVYYHAAHTDVRNIKLRR
ncbi:uncharacterized protein LOC141913026 [Tubulanus polymorphus]|uniref:uncharacterized protein LOC141913026 n=1 Tax=Tubulanus polymorphus TaxID=672921 RepID=UPI003DA34F8D